MSDVQTPDRENAEDIPINDMVDAQPEPQRQVAVQSAQRANIAAGAQLAAVVPRTLNDVIRYAEVVFRSRLAPYGLRDQAAITVAILTGMELGLKPMAALRSIAVINGRPSIWGDAGMAMPRQQALLVKHKEWFTGTPGQDDWEAHCLVQRRGEDEREGSFSVAEAKIANLWGKRGRPKDGAAQGEPTPWITYPKRMLMWRARIVFRDVFPDVLLGMRFAEEVADDEMVDVTPPVVTVGSGIAARLPGVAPGGSAGFGADVAAAVNGGGEDEKRSAGSAPDAGGAVDAAAADKGGADTGGGAPSEGGGADTGGGGGQSIAEADKKLLDELFAEFVGAVKPAEVEAVWLAFKEAIDHSSAEVQKRAGEKYQAKKAAATAAAEKKAALKKAKQ